MKKTLVFAMLALGVGVVSCQNEKNATEDGRLIDVVATSVTSDTKSEVTAGGTTSWSVTDKIIILDVDRTPRLFTYASSTPKTSSAFNGKLLAGKGTQIYYAYHLPRQVTGDLNLYDLTLTMSDVNVAEDGVVNSALFGEYCAMVAIPVSFDAENSADSKNFQFYHINSLIEASISSIPSKGILLATKLDKIVFTLTATDGSSPFNKQVTVNLRNIIGPLDVNVPYAEGSSKVNSISTTIALNSPKTIADLLVSGTSSCGIPLFAFPTRTNFKCAAVVELFLEGKLVCKLQRMGGLNGLKLAGLNVIDFDENDIVP